MSRRVNWWRLAGVAAAVVLASCSGDTNRPDAAELRLPTDVPVADDVIIATEDGLAPTVTTNPPFVPALEDQPDTLTTTTDVSGSSTPTGSDVGQPATPDSTSPPAVDSTQSPVPGEPIPTIALPTAPIAPPAAGVPARVVSMSSSHTEMLIAMGAGDLIVGVAPANNFVAAARPLEDPRLQLESTTLPEVTRSLEPTIVILSETEVASNTDFVGSDLPLYVGRPASSLTEIYQQITDLGELVGRGDAAALLVGDMQRDVEQILSGLGDRTQGGLRVFHEVDPSLVTFDDSYFLMGLFAELGLTNVYEGTGDQIPQMTNEQVVAAAPDVITFGDVDCCAVSSADLGARRGWNTIPAVERGAMVPLSDAEYSTWGPGVVDVLARVADAMSAA